MKKGIEAIIWVIQPPPPQKKEDERLLIKHIVFAWIIKIIALVSTLLVWTCLVDKKIFYNHFKYIFLIFLTIKCMGLLVFLLSINFNVPQKYRA